MIDLKGFCSSFRVELTSPFSDGGETFATDGSIGIIVPGDLAPAYAECGKFVRGLRFFREASRQATFRPIPSFSGPITVPDRECNECRGTGYVRPCGDCPPDDEQECKTCNSSEFVSCNAGDPGSEECGSCDGKGSHTAHVRVMIVPGVTVAGHYLSQALSTNPHEFATFPCPKTGMTLIAFRSAGAFVILAPLDPKRTSGKADVYARGLEPEEALPAGPVA